MHFSSIIAPLSLLAIGASAAALKRDDLHAVDFRSFGAIGCDTENQGIWTFTESQATGECITFASFGADDVQAVSLVDIKSGCSLELYPDDTCSQLSESPDTGECTSGEHRYESFRLQC